MKSFKIKKQVNPVYWEGLEMVFKVKTPNGDEEVVYPDEQYTAITPELYEELLNEQ